MARPTSRRSVRCASRVALSTNMIPLKQAEPTTKASSRSSQAWNTSASLRKSSMPSDQAVATVNNAPKRIGITRVMGPIRSLLEAHARENYTELIPIARGSEELVDEHRDSGIGIHLQPVGGN